uniref:DYW domain-containing protein n=2 Tax=Nymphaea colorata TaxID=210225 RepID=A0A5K1E332_9MAGN
MIVNGVLFPSSLANLLAFLVDPDHGDYSYGLLLFRQVQNASSTYLWNTIIRGSSRNGRPTTSIDLYGELRVKGLRPDSHTFSFLFKACALALDLQFGKRGHGEAIRFGFESDTFIADSLIHMYSVFGRLDDAKRVFDGMVAKSVASWTSLVGVYAKVGLVDDARRLFDEMPERNVVSWTTMIRGYSECNREMEAMFCFREMMSVGVKPDSVALLSLLRMCARLQNLDLGKWVHQFAYKEGIEMNDRLAVSVIDMYSKCEDVYSARRVFNDMPRKNLVACNSIIDGYCKEGKVEDARLLFDQMPTKDLISFNSMIAGHVQSGQYKEAWTLFCDLRVTNLKPDSYTMVSLLSACANMGALDAGKIIHSFIIVNLIETDVFLGTSLLDMYAKCGRIHEAMLVFGSMTQKDVLAWTAIISGLAMHGRPKTALDHFAKMQRAGIKPNDITLVGVLTACSHGGLVEEGRLHFKQMQDTYLLTPKVEHYGCMVDLLGRAGRLKEAEELITSMPMEPDAIIWASLLAACRTHNNVFLAEMAAKKLLDLEPHKDAIYVILYNIYASMGKWYDASKTRERMENAGIKKECGRSSIMVHGGVHEFIAGDKTHPRFEQIQAMISEISRQLMVAGYVPITSDVLLDIDDEEKEHALFFHSEKMAVAFGLISLPANVPIHIMKNLRVCRDCHSALKSIAKVYNREIIIRDRSRFHHFRGGLCSCNDYW